MKRVKIDPERKGKGRPREFDTEKALDAALRIFWQKGYEGAGLTDLTKAMGINRPSMYAAFGNKETLFRKVMDRYAKRSQACAEKEMAAGSSRDVAERLLRGAADSFTQCGSPAGCFLVQGAMACSEAKDPLQREVAARRAKMEAMLRERFACGTSSAGDLPGKKSACEMAAFVSTVMHGMAVQAANGMTREMLHRVVDVAMRAWK
jgi:AcrR family transcriptional regulator